MANWKKIITSGSNAELNNITTSGLLSTDGGINYVLSSQTGSMTTEWDGTHDGNGVISGSLEVSGSTFTVNAVGAIDIDSTAAIDINVAADSTIATTVSGQDLTVGVSGGGAQTLTLSSAGTGTNAIDINATAGGLDVDVAGALSIDANDDSDITVSTSAKDLTIGVSGGSTQVLKFDSAGTGTDAIDINATAGGIDIDANGAATLDSATSIGVGTNSSGIAITIGHGTSEVTIGDNLTVTGDLTVDGTTTSINTAQLSVSESLIFLASGSEASNMDAGILVQTGSLPNSGSALFHDVSTQRWAVATGIKTDDISVTPLAYVQTITASTNPPAASTENGAYGIGEMWLDTDSSDGPNGNGVIYIRTV